MEDQDYDTILAECGDGLWTDDVFPPKNSSICPAQDWKEETYGEYEWVRATKVPVLTDDEGDLQVFVDDPTPDDINQGALGDCYFLSALSVLAEHPRRIKRIFKTDRVNEQGVYGVNVTKNGVPITVVLDDYIVCKEAFPVFSQASGNELWVLLIEKAWAKIHGSFERIIAGQAHLTMRDLSGAPGYEHIIKDTPDIFEMILDADQKDYCMAVGCGLEDSDKEALRELGLVTEHSYGIIAAANVVDSNGNTAQICKLRNPWGSFEWKGDWGDESDLWTEELRQELNVTVANDGCFWMDVETMKLYFDRVQICKYEDDFVYSHQSVTNNSEFVSKINIQAPGMYTFSVSQKGARMFRSDSGYSYSAARLYLAKDNGDGTCVPIKGNKAYGSRDTYLECQELEEGEYFFCAEVDWNEETADQDFVVTCYGASDVNLATESEQTKNQIVRMIAQSLVQTGGESVETEPNEEDDKIVKSTIGGTDFGYNIIMIQNGADSSGYKEDVNYPTFDGLTLMEPESGNGYSVLVAAGETKVILIKQSCRGYGYSSSFSSSVQMGTESLVAKAIEEGEKAERGDGVYCMKLQHSGGIIMVYKNDTENQVLNEELGLELTGLEVDGQDDQTKVVIKLGPGEQQVVNLKTTGGGWGFASSCSYSIGSA